MTMAKKILGINIDEIIRMAINESLPTDEKKLQAKKAKEMKQFKSTAKKEVDEAEDETVGKDNVKKVKAADIVNLLGIMRSGKSLKDEEIRKDFQMYFDALSGTERVALFAFIEAIADIVSGVNSDEDIRDQPQPDDYGVDTDPIKSKKAKKTTKAPAQKEKQNDDSTPIVVGEAADKSREKALLRRYK